MQKDNELICFSLHMRANYIETGDVSLSADDCIERSEHKKIKLFSSDQKELVRRLRNLASKVQKSSFYHWRDYDPA